MEAAVHSAKVYYQQYGEFLDGQKCYPARRTTGRTRHISNLEMQSKTPQEMRIRGMEVAGGKVYPAVTRVINILARNGVITKEQLALIDREELQKMPGIKEKTFKIVVLLRNICKIELRIQELKSVG